MQFLLTLEAQFQVFWHHPIKEHFLINFHCSQLLFLIVKNSTQSGLERKSNTFFDLCFIYEKNCKLSYNESPNEIDLHIALCIKYIILLGARSNHIRTI